MGLQLPRAIEAGIIDACGAATSGTGPTISSRRYVRSANRLSGTSPKERNDDRVSCVPALRRQSASR